MTESKTWSEELDGLLEHLCDEQLSEDQRVRLNSILRLQPDARWRYLTYLDLHSALSWEGIGSSTSTAAAITSSESAMAEGPIFQGSIELALERPAILTVRTSVAPSKKMSRAARTNAGRKAPAATRIALTIAVVVTVLLLAVLALRSKTHPNLVTPKTSNLAPMIVARLTDSIEAKWETNSQRSVGAEIGVDERLRLATGQAEVTFDSGARLRLIAPVHFDVQSESNGFLHFGTLTADVPVRARGFTINTKDTQVVDLGTRFAMLAARNRDTEVHVFQGRVDVAVLQSDGGIRETIELSSNQAVRIRIAQQRSERLAARPELFGLNNDAVGARPRDLLVEDFNYPIGSLVGNDQGTGWSGPWRNVYGGDENRVAQADLRHASVSHVGNRAVIPGRYHRTQRTLDTRAGGIFDQAGCVETRDGIQLIGRSGSTIEFRFLQRVSDLDGGFYGVELHRGGDDDRTRVLSIGRGAVDPGYGVVSDLNGGAGKTYQSLGIENTDVNLVVLRIRFGASNHDVLEVFRNPTAGEQTPDAKLTGDFAFDRISLGGFDGSHLHEVDQLRITHLKQRSAAESGAKSKIDQE